MLRSPSLPTAPCARYRAPRGAAYKLFEWSDDLTIIRGPHTLKTGFSYKDIQSFEETVNDLAGSIEFDGDTDPGLDGILGNDDDPGTSGLWDFLNGNASELEVQWKGANEDRTWDMQIIGLFLQDDFRLKPNLTLNLGVRWEFMTSPTEIDGKCANISRPEQVLPFNLETGDVGPNARDGAPLGKVGCPFFETFKDNFAPRVGFAWDTRSDAKLVVRAGFGIFHNQPVPIYWKAAGRCCPPFAIETAIQPPFPFAKADTFVDFSNPPTDPVDIRSYDYSGTTYMMQYNFNIQSQIRPGTAVTIGYSGSQGRKLPITRELQTIPREIRNGQTFFVQEFFDADGNPRSIDLSGPDADLRNPYASSMLMGGTQGSSNYNALLISADHRFGGGLRAQVNYTFSKTMSHGDTIYGADLGGGLNSTGMMDGLELGRDWGPANYHIPHVLSVNYTYDLPFQGVGAMDKLIGGWQLSGIFSRQAGVAFDARTARFPDHRRAPSRRDYLRVDLLGTTNNPIEGTFSGDCLVSSGVRKHVGKELGGPDIYFDPCAFGQPEAGFFGNLGKNTLTGPGLTKLDFSVIKNTSITERVSLQFRAEFFNIANTPNFQAPSAGFGGRGGRFVFGRGGKFNPGSTTGRIDTTVTTARQIQFGLKLVF